MGKVKSKTSSGEASAEVWQLLKELLQAQKQTEAEIKKMVEERKREAAEVAAERKREAAERKREAAEVAAERAAERKREAAERKREAAEVAAERAAERKREAAEVAAERAAERKREAAEVAAERKREAAKRAAEWRAELKDRAEANKIEDRKTKIAFQKMSAEVRELSVSSKRLEKSINKASGDFDNQWGKFVEILASVKFEKALRKLGIKVDRVTQRALVRDSEGQLLAECDISASNGTQAVGGEVKTTLRREDVDKFVGLMEEYAARLFGDDKDVYAAMAFMHASKDVRDYAISKGFILLQAPGGDVQLSTLINSVNFKPRAFSTRKDDKHQS